MSLSNEIHNCCPFCGGDGFTVHSYMGEAEQEQCQFCYERAYPLAGKVKELEARIRELEAEVRRWKLSNADLSDELHGYKFPK